MHIKYQGPTPKVTVSQAQKHAKFKCPHVGCGFCFNNKHGMRVHAGKCSHKQTHYMEKILAVEGECGDPNRRFLIRWFGYGEEEDTWEPYSSIDPQAIKEFLLSNGKYNFD